MKIITNKPDNGFKDLQKKLDKEFKQLIAKHDAERDKLQVLLNQTAQQSGNGLTDVQVVEFSKKITQQANQHNQESRDLINSHHLAIKMRTEELLQQTFLKNGILLA